jgi:hypothetical protein
MGICSIIIVLMIEAGPRLNINDSYCNTFDACTC